MLTLAMLPAGHGDCLWIEYGDPKKPRRVLIDGGATGTYKRALRDKLKALPENERRFELMMVTHIDADHITGILDLLNDKEVGFSADDIWFNGYRHLPDEAPDTMGAVQGEKLTALLTRPGISWNGAFKKRAVVVPPDGPLPRIELPGGMVLTVLSPTPAKLADLKPAWEKEVRKAGLDPSMPAPAEPTEEGFEVLAGGLPDIDDLAAQAFSEDSAEANGSSIAVLAEVDGRSLLLTGDAYPTVLTAAIKRIDPQRLNSKGKLEIDSCKLPHHASKANVSRELLNALVCPQYLFSTNGSHFKHPDAQAVARVIKFGGKTPELTFNYRTKFNDAWASAKLVKDHGYKPVYPQQGDGILVEWK